MKDACMTPSDETEQPQPDGLSESPRALVKPEEHRQASRRIPPSIFTRTGDTGYTGLLDGTRLPKAHAVIEANGTIDELSCELGMVGALLTQGLPQHPGFRPGIEQVEWLQDKLFGLASMIAAILTPDMLKPLLTEGDVRQLEGWVSTLQAQLPPLSNFIVPGGSVLVSQIHIARATARRAERACAAITLDEAYELNPMVIPFLNRLSDFLFMLGRWATYESGQPEKIWRER